MSSSRQFGVVVGADFVNKEPVKYCVAKIDVSRLPDGNLSWKYAFGFMGENDIKKTINGGLRWLNVSIGKDGKIHGTTGDLKRFEKSKNGFRPLVILSQLYNSKNELIGFRYIDINKQKVNRAPLTEIIKICEEQTRLGNIPIQNAIYVPREIYRDPNKPNSADKLAREAHIKSYPDHPFIKEIMIQINKNTNVVKKAAEQKDEKKITKDDFTKAQWEQLKLGREHKVNIGYYANPDLTAEKMKYIREALENGLDVRYYARPEFSAEAIKFYSSQQLMHRDIRKYINPAYSFGQLMVISMVEIEGLDLSKVSDPKLSVNEMERKRQMMKSGIFFSDADFSKKWV